MLERLIRASFAARALVIMLLSLGVGAGVVAYGRLSTDVFPDLTVPVFNVITQNTAMAPEELEPAVTLPVETALNGLPGVVRVRSVTQLGVSQVTVEFAGDMDYWRARQLVSERLNQAQRDLPAGTRPPLVSSLTNRLNEVFEYLVEGDLDPMDLRDIAEFDLRYRILSVPGVASVERLGGQLRQYQVLLDAGRMQAQGVTLEEAMRAVGRSSVNAPGGFVSQGATEFSIRGLGQIRSIDDLRESVIKSRGGIPVRVRDVAAVVEAGAVRRGLADAGGREVVSSRVIKQFGADTVRVTGGIKAALEEFRQTLPPGVRIRTVYDQSELIQHALGTVVRAILAGAVLVVLVLLVLLGEIRSALVVTVTLPLSVILAGVVMHAAGVGLNTMTLGGLAIAVGILVDAAIIMTENIHHRLSIGNEDRTLAVLRAAVEVGRPIAFATAIVIAVFTPLFLMSGVEGRLYHPLAATVTAAMAASLLLALTFVPAMCWWFLRRVPARREGPRAEAADESSQDVRVMRMIKRAYVPALDLAFRHAWLVRGIALLVTVPAFVGLLRVGTEFMPELDERALLIQTMLPGEASLEEVDRVNRQVERVIADHPGVESVSRRSGRSDETEDPMPHVLSDILVTLKRAAGSRPTEAVVDELRDALAQVPGPTVLFTTPLGMRIDEGLGGTPAELSIKVFGPDMETLNRKAAEIAAVAREVRGVTDLRIEETSDVPQLQVALDRAAAARLGVTAGELAEAVQVGLAGEEVATFWRGQRNYAILLRAGEGFRRDAESIAALPIAGAAGPVQIGQIARVEMREGPAIIRRENIQRRVAVEGSVEGRDMGSTIVELQQRIAKSVSLPPGYRTDFGGRFEQQQRALRSLQVAVALAVALVLILLFAALGSYSEVAVILLTLPDAFVGGILAMLLTGQTLNVSTGVGFIGLFGIAVQNGLVLISQTRGLTGAGVPFDKALRSASIGRVRPKLMTAACAMLGLLPLVLLPGQGSELERPLAIVMIGGLVTSTIFTLLALPTFYSLVADLRARLGLRMVR